MKNVSVLRLNHRKSRDKRVTTHVFLTARALGATSGILCGESDSALVSSVNKTSRKWGGEFFVRYEKNWRALIKEHAKTVVHLTMYGEPVQNVISQLRKKDELLVVVGASKVPPDVYKHAAYNVSVTNQPHSEISSLAIFLHELFGGRELKKTFQNASVKIVPKKKGKHVIKKDNNS
ncbi:tRNA (cytidine(56)-2'-O)-methyltransferase [archaeon CG10_big_fil_rev_8_21_14_0_10_43_11]|nr:MAG: tRNA (cytidine(56)-2'-O)-methyltransferase [archaeon CG10_big_fil_rev_8_21_14_0_10_43_11]